MATEDDRPARAPDDRDLVVIEDDQPVASPDAVEHGAAAAPAARRWLPLAVLAVPVVTVLALLGVRAASGGAFDPDAAGLRVSAVADALTGTEDGMVFGGGTGGPGTSMTGGSSVAPGEDLRDLTVVCASEGGRGGHLTVVVGGETVGEADVACSDGADPGQEPRVTVLPIDEFGAGWSFTVETASRAAVTVVLS